MNNHVRKSTTLSQAPGKFSTGEYDEYSRVLTHKCGPSELSALSVLNAASTPVNETLDSPN